MKASIPAVAVLMLCAALAGCATGVPAGQCDKTGDYDLPPQRFDETAQAMVHASGCFVRTDLSKTGPVSVNAVHGRMTLRQALKRAIAGTPLRITENRPDSVTIRRGE